MRSQARNQGKMPPKTGSMEILRETRNVVDGVPWIRSHANFGHEPTAAVA